MDGGFDKNQTIGDYSTLLEALLPEAIGFYCVDRKARRFFEQPPARAVEFSDEYDAAIAVILQTPERAAEVGRVDLETAIAILVPLDAENARIFGVLTILFQAGSELEYPSCVERAQSAIRSLQRELMLRYRLVTAYRKLNIRSAEENLMHQVEKLVHLRRSCEDTLSHILLLACSSPNAATAG